MLKAEETLSSQINVFRIRIWAHLVLNLVFFFSGVEEVTSLYSDD